MRWQVPSHVGEEHAVTVWVAVAALCLENSNTGPTMSESASATGSTIDEWTPDGTGTDVDELFRNDDL